MSEHRSEPMRLTLVGGPTLLIEVAGLRLLTDPTFDPPGPHPVGATLTLTKRTGPAVAPEALGPIDAVPLSHDQHPDNLDGAGRALLPSARRVITTPAGAARLGGATGLAPWERTVVTGPGGRALVLTGAPARHGPPGIEPIAGPVTGFVVSTPAGRDLVYVTGDTVWYEGTAEVARRFRPELVIAFAGAARTRGPFDLTLSAGGVLEAAHAFPGATLVPVHAEGWAHFTESQEDVERAFTALGLRDRLLLLERGRPVELAPRPSRDQRSTDRIRSAS